MTYVSGFPKILKDIDWNNCEATFLGKRNSFLRIRNDNKELLAYKDVKSGLTTKEKQNIRKSTEFVEWAASQKALRNNICDKTKFDSKKRYEIAINAGIPREGIEGQYKGARVLSYLDPHHLVEYSYNDLTDPSNFLFVWKPIHFMYYHRIKFIRQYINPLKLNYIELFQLISQLAAIIVP